MHVEAHSLKKEAHVNIIVKECSPLSAKAQLKVRKTLKFFSSSLEKYKNLCRVGTDSWTFAKKKKLQNDKDLLPGFTDLGMEESHQIIKKTLSQFLLGSL